jgi:hypothetical protein
MATLNSDAYDRLVFDKAADTALHIGRDTELAKKVLLPMFVMENIDVRYDLIEAVQFAQTHLDYEVSTYRGREVDEGVVEAIKEILRVVHEKDLFTD